MTNLPGSFTNNSQIPDFINSITKTKTNPNQGLHTIFILKGVRIYLLKVFMPKPGVQFLKFWGFGPTFRASMYPGRMLVPSHA